MTGQFTELERAIFAEYARAYSDAGFPAIDRIVLLARTNTGVGRYVDIRSEVALGSDLADYTGLLAGPTLWITGLSLPLAVVLAVDKGHVGQVEMVTQGNDHWDGSEQLGWAIEPISTEEKLRHRGPSIHSP